MSLIWKNVFFPGFKWLLDVSIALGCAPDIPSDHEKKNRGKLIFVFKFYSYIWLNQIYCNSKTKNKLFSRFRNLFFKKTSVGIDWCCFLGKKTFFFSHGKSIFLQNVHFLYNIRKFWTKKKDSEWIIHSH